MQRFFQIFFKKRWLPDFQSRFSGCSKEQKYLGCGFAKNPSWEHQNYSRLSENSKRLRTVLLLVSISKNYDGW